MVLFNLWARWYYLQRCDMERYRDEVRAYYADQVDRCVRLVTEHLDAPGHSRLRSLCEEKG